MKSLEQLNEEQLLQAIDSLNKDPLGIKDLDAESIVILTSRIEKVNTKLFALMLTYFYAMPKPQRVEFMRYIYRRPKETGEFLLDDDEKEIKEVVETTQKTVLKYICKENDLKLKNIGSDCGSSGCHIDWMPTLKDMSKMIDTVWSKIGG